MEQLRIDVPRELEPLRAELHYFMQSMVKKLHINRHKGFVEGKTTDELMHGLYGEVEELRDALEGQGQFEALLEAVDVANMAFLVGAKVAQMTKVEYENERKAL